MAWRLKSWSSCRLQKHLLKLSAGHECIHKVTPTFTASRFIYSPAFVCNLDSKKKFLTNNNAERVPWLLHNRHFSVPVATLEQFKLSDIGEGIREVTVKEWYVNVGDHVNQFDNICEVQSDKASVTITSRFKGIIRKRYCDIDQIVLVGNPLCDIEVIEEVAESKRESAISYHSEEKDSSPNVPPSQISQSRSDEKKVLATPAVRRMAMENKLQLSKITGTGKDGRILKEDILAFLDQPSAVGSKPEVKIREPTPTPSVMPSRHIESVLQDKTVPISGFTKVMLKTMTAALKIPHFVYSDEINVTNLIEVRSKLQPIAMSHGIKLTYLPFFVKAASMAMSLYPIVNSSMDEKCENIIFKAKHNIGIAMDTPAGLAVPNVKDVQSLTLLEVAKELNRLQEDGMKGTLKPSDVTGGTFTLSNIGPIGGTYTKPVILPPEVAIGAIGRIQALPRFDSNGNVTKASILYISWSADHRVLDGATIARFSNVWKEYIENPPSMLLNLK